MIRQSLEETFYIIVTKNETKETNFTFLLIMFYIYVRGEKIKGGLKLVDNEIRFGDYNKTGGHNNRNDEKVI